MEIKQTISKHPLMGFEREVVISMIAMNYEGSQANVYFKINYYMGGNILPYSFNEPEYFEIGDALVVQKDENNEPILNPDYNKEFEGEGEFLVKTAFETLKNNFNDDFIKNYIIHMDSEEKFNFN